MLITASVLTPYSVKFGLRCNFEHSVQQGCKYAFEKCALNSTAKINRSHGVIVVSREARVASNSRALSLPVMKEAPVVVCFSPADTIYTLLIYVVKRCQEFTNRIPVRFL